MTFVSQLRPDAITIGLRSPGGGAGWRQEPWVGRGACLRGSRASEGLGTRLDGGRDLVSRRPRAYFFIYNRVFSTRSQLYLPFCEC
jgi:hypothetical protein